MDLQNFEKTISPAILKKGKEYFKAGYVSSLEQTGNTWVAEVDGNDCYDVEVTLKNDIILATSCNCLHDTNFCKHIVAVFYAIKKELEKPVKKTAKKDVFGNIINTVSLAEYQDFILMYSAKNKNFKTEFELHFADKDSRVDVLAKYSDLVKKIIKKHTSQGFIDYRSSIAFAREIDNLTKSGHENIAKNNVRDTFMLAKAALLPVMETYEYADDSNGSIGGAIANIIDLFDKINDKNDASFEIKEQIFVFIANELENNLYFDYGDFGYDLGQTLLEVGIKINSEEFTNIIDELLKKLKKDGYRREFYEKLKIEFLQKTGNTKEAETLIEANMDIVEIRKKIVATAIQDKNYAKAKALINEGIIIAEKLGHPGTVDGWKKDLLEIAYKEKDIENIRKYTKLFAFDHHFSIKYYKEWRATYSEAEWRPLIDAKIEKMIILTTETWKIENAKRYWKTNHPPLLRELSSIYIQENYIDRLLILVQQENNLDATLAFQEVLGKAYPAELMEIYKVTLPEYGHKTGDRRGYEDLVKKMKTIIKTIPSGKNEVKQIAQTLKDAYSIKPRRPAMIEEMDKVLKL